MTISSLDLLQPADSYLGGAPLPHAGTLAPNTGNTNEGADQLRAYNWFCQCAVSMRKLLELAHRPTDFEALLASPVLVPSRERVTGDPRFAALAERLAIVQERCLQRAEHSRCSSTVIVRREFVATGPTFRVGSLSESAVQVADGTQTFEVCAPAGFTARTVVIERRAAPGTRAVVAAWRPTTLPQGINVVATGSMVLALEAAPIPRDVSRRPAWLYRRVDAVAELARTHPNIANVFEGALDAHSISQLAQWFVDRRDYVNGADFLYRKFASTKGKGAARRRVTMAIALLRFPSDSIAWGRRIDAAASALQVFTRTDRQLDDLRDDVIGVLGISSPWLALLEGLHVRSTHDAASQYDGWRDRCVRVAAAAVLLAELDPEHTVTLLEMLALDVGAAFESSVPRDFFGASMTWRLRTRDVETSDELVSASRVLAQASARLLRDPRAGGVSFNASGALWWAALDAELKRVHDSHDASIGDFAVSAASTGLSTLRHATERDVFREYSDDLYRSYGLDFSVTRDGPLMKSAIDRLSPNRKAALLRGLVTVQLGRAEWLLTRDDLAADLATEPVPRAAESAVLSAVDWVDFAGGIAARHGDIRLWQCYESCQRAVTQSALARRVLASRPALLRRAPAPWKWAADRFDQQRPLVALVNDVLRGPTSRANLFALCEAVASPSVSAATCLAAIRPIVLQLQTRMPEWLVASSWNDDFWRLSEVFSSLACRPGALALPELASVLVDLITYLRENPEHQPRLLPIGLVTPLCLFALLTRDSNNADVALRTVQRHQTARRDPYVRVLAARVALRIKRPEDAAALLDATPERGDRHEKLWSGLACMAMNDWSRATEFLQAAYDDQPRPDTGYQLAVSLLRLGRADDARLILDRVQDARAHLLLASLADTAGDSSGATSHVIAAANLALATGNAHELRAVATRIATEVVRQPSSSDWRALATWMLDSGDGPGAMMLLALALAGDSTHWHDVLEYVRRDTEVVARRAAQYLGRVLWRSTLENDGDSMWAQLEVSLALLEPRRRAEVCATIIGHPKGEVPRWWSSRADALQASVGEDFGLNDAILQSLDAIRQRASEDASGLVGLVIDASHTEPDYYRRLESAFLEDHGRMDVRFLRQVVGQVFRRQLASFGEILLNEATALGTTSRANLHLALLATMARWRDAKLEERAHTEGRVLEERCREIATAGAGFELIVSPEVRNKTASLSGEQCTHLISALSSAGLRRVELNGSWDHHIHVLADLREPEASKRLELSLTRMRLVGIAVEPVARGCEIVIEARDPSSVRESDDYFATDDSDLR